MSMALAEAEAEAAVAQPPPATDISLNLCLRDPPARAMLSPAQQRFVESVVNCIWHWLWQQVSSTPLSFLSSICIQPFLCHRGAC